MTLDSGSEATESILDLTLSYKLRPRWIEVRDSPERAVDNAVAELVAQGFVVAPQDVGALLAKQESPWVVRVVQIGDTAGAWRRWLLIEVADLVPFASVLIRRRMEYLPVMVTARWTDQGTTELVIGPGRFPIPADTDFASPARRFATAAGKVADGYAQGGGLVGEPRSASYVKDPTCPAHIPFAKKLMRQASRSRGASTVSGG